MKYIPEDLWRELEKLIPKKESRVGWPEFDNRRALSGVIFILKTGAQWNMLPEKYGISTTVHGKFMCWCRKGIFQKMVIPRSRSSSFESKARSSVVVLVPTALNSLSTKVVLP